MIQEACIICSIPAQTTLLDHYHYECKKCGKFSITEDAKGKWPQTWKTPQFSSIISHWVNVNKIQEIDTNTIKIIGKLKPIPVYEKSNKLLRYLINRTSSPGQLIGVPLDTTKAHLLNLLSTVAAYDQTELVYLMDFLSEKNYISFKYRGDHRHDVIVTPAGFSYEQTLNNEVNTNLGFCAMWFDESLNHVWESAIEPAIKQAGYHASRIDKHPHNDGVVDEIFSQIRRSKFIVADLTGDRGGVYYEAGFARGLGRGVIFMCEKEFFEENKLHFDVLHYNFLLWEKDKLDDFRAKLAYRIESTLGRGLIQPQIISAPF